MWIKKPVTSGTVSPPCRLQATVADICQAALTGLVVHVLPVRDFWIRGPVGTGIYRMLGVLGWIQASSPDCY